MKDKAKAEARVRSQRLQETLLGSTAAVLTFVLIVGLSMLPLMNFMNSTLLGWVQAEVLRLNPRADDSWVAVCEVIVFALVLTTSAAIMKYIWLLAVCRVLKQTEVVPLLTSMYPVRRLTRFDRWLLHRLYFE